MREHTETVDDFQDVLVTCGCARNRPDYVERNLLERSSGREQFQVPVDLVLSHPLGGTLATFSDTGEDIDSHDGLVIVAAHGRVHPTLTAVSCKRGVVTHV